MEVDNTPLKRTISDVDELIKPIADASTAVDDAVGVGYDFDGADATDFGDVLEAFDCCVQRVVPYFLMLVRFLD